jgi:hypothetical protein
MEQLKLTVNETKTHIRELPQAAYGEIARAAGHEVKYIEVAKLAFPVLRGAEEFLSRDDAGRHCRRPLG